ncbi:hypothetical protein I316_04763 [Kwoniella heveanensis BCC8398]|uniref:SEC7 domain-containing protein n=1 Tax=Kwoniella heveanensis BCC8398 TaxID=1296120 RepID=A0A1B9GRI3_9TREE|nr:hypothetical protein I316_04763 [Kwoniella heveanensis BCC8398]
MGGFASDSDSRSGTTDANANANAEAGPSKLRIAPPARPVPSTPPATPPSVSAAAVAPGSTSTAKAKRRSWFSIGSPSVSLSATATTPTSKSSKQEKRRSSASVNNAGVEELELGSVIGGSRQPGDESTSGSSRRGSKTVEFALNDNGHMDDWNGQSRNTSKGKERAEPDEISTQQAEEEILNIDGNVENTIKKKKKRRSGGQPDPDLDVMRMEDLGDRLRGKARGDSMRSVSDVTVRPNSIADEQSTPQALPARTFSRTASDRDPFAPPVSTPQASAASALNSRPNILPRKSSMNSQTEPRPSITYTTDKSQPPIPVDNERPLPPLPSSGSGPSLKTTNTAPRTGLELSSIEIPRGIVVTPSSPRKLSKTPKKTVVGERRTRSATGRPRDVIPSKRAQSAAPSTTIGLGLPSALLPSSKSNTDSPPPPPVPSKPQSVSSPFPSRSPSPLPRIAFVEPEVPPSQQQNESQIPSDGKRNRVRRARSLSGLFGKTPPVIHNARMEDTASQNLSADANDSPLSESASKTSGVLEWLGVRKTVKRKMSAAKLKDVVDRAITSERPDNGSEFLDSQESGQKSEELRSPSPSEWTSPNLEAQQQTPRQHLPQPGRSTTPASFTGGQGKLSSIFNRRASARNTDDESDAPSVKIAPVPIPNAGRRNQTAASSQSSFNLPPVDPISPFVPENGPWMHSPQTEGEETLFSPEGSTHWGPGVRPWMDGSERRNSSRSSISSPLDSLPEQGPPTAQSPLKPPPNLREGRVRSWSDAPLPPQRVTAGSSNPHLPLPRPTTSGPHPQSISLSSSPQTPSRPKLGNRANSGNSAILGRMRSVFSKSTNRSRSNSLFRQASSEIDDFGNITLQGHDPIRMRSSTSSSSITSSGAARGRSIGDENARPSLGPQVDLTERRSPRSSFTPSMSSLGSAVQAILPESTAQVQGESKAARRNRVRASTISLAPTSYHFAPPASPGILPAAATPPRRRPGTIHRLSNGLFGSGPSSPRSSSLFPLPPRSSGSISSSATTGLQWDEISNEFLSPGTSPRPSTGSISATVSANSGAVKEASARDGQETPRQWLDRVVATVGRHDISNVLAASGDDFHTEALRIYMATFDFTHNALDVALRRLLMHISLPKETQQIDRVIEAFAQRYEACEPGLFGQKDNTYVLAFSMMMLHTDAFNKHNKNKMTKPDYVRNTRMEGVSPLVLEAFFDNITYTPFVFIEDDSDLRRSSGYESSSSTFGPSTPTFSGPLQINGPPNPPTGKAKTDVYHMIVRGLLGSLRVDVEHQIPAETPFSTFGTRPFMDMERCCRAFANAHSLIIPSTATGHGAGSALGIGITNERHLRKVPGKLTTPARRHTVSEHRHEEQHHESETVLRVTKVGLLSRKDDTTESSKKASRKWKSWSVILTGSQLLFFKDPTWALTLLEQARSTDGTERAGQMLLPRQTTFKPDEVHSLKECIAVYDRTYTASQYTFRFVMPQSRQYLLQASDEYEMNEWITLINYASAFKTANLKMKGPTMRKDQVVLAGAAAAASHQRELKVDLNEHGSFESPSVDNNNAPPQSASHSNSTLSSLTPSHHHLRSKIKKSGSVDLDEANEVVHEGEQLEEVFGVVKAELAAGRGEAGSGAIAAGSMAPPADKAPVHTTRVAHIYDHLRLLRERSEPLEAALSTSLLLARNIALLTPFQRSTRDRLSSSIAPIAHRVRSDRLILAKLKLWIRVLEHEGEREDREWKVVRHVALQAAARSLREDGVQGVVKDINEQQRDEEGGGVRAVPRLALPPDIKARASGDVNVIADGMGPKEEMRDAGNGDDYNSDDVRRKEHTSPVELPEMIRRPSDEPTPDFPHHSRFSESTRRPSTSDGHPGSGSKLRTGTGTEVRSTSDSKSPSGRAEDEGDILQPPLRRVTSASDLLSPTTSSQQGSLDRFHLRNGLENGKPKNNRSASAGPTGSTSTSTSGKSPSSSMYLAADASANTKTGNTNSHSANSSGRETPTIIFPMESPLEMDENVERVSPFVPRPSAEPSNMDKP